MTTERTQHTPEPWRTSTSNADGDFSGMPVVLNWKGYLVADFGVFGGAPKSDGEMHANAALGAAAPDLLEAAKAAAPLLEEVGRSSWMGDSDPHVIAAKNLRAAIAKAEGGTS